MHILHSASTGTHDITVYETSELYGERGRFRVLAFADGAVQGAIDLDDPQRIVFEYPRAILHLMEKNNPDYRDVFAIGHGIGTIASRCGAHRRFKTAELDEEVAAISRRFFGYSGDGILIGDGSMLLEAEPDDAYDYVIVDAFTERGVPRQLCSQSFFGLAAAKLGDGGSILLNLFGRGASDPLVGAIHTTLRTRFAFSRAFSLPRQGAADTRNIILIGSSAPIAYQARRMAGFEEIELQESYVLADGAE